MAEPDKHASVKDTAIPRKDIDTGDVESFNGGPDVVVETARVLDHDAEVKLCRKFDIRILPFLAIMCKWQPVHPPFTAVHDPDADALC